MQVSVRVRLTFTLTTLSLACRLTYWRWIMFTLLQTLFVLICTEPSSYTIKVSNCIEKELCVCPYFSYSCTANVLLDLLIHSIHIKVEYITVCLQSPLSATMHQMLDLVFWLPQNSKQQFPIFDLWLLLSFLGWKSPYVWIIQAQRKLWQVKS